MKYTVLIDKDKDKKGKFKTGMLTGKKTISEEGALLIAKALIKAREKQSGIAWESEINMWIEKGFLPADFKWEEYIVK